MGGAGLKMLLTGSIGMAALERAHHLDPVHLNDLRPFTVPPLGDEDPEEPGRFVDALVQGQGLHGWTDEHTSALLYESDSLFPSFLQFAFARLAAIPPPAPQEFANIFANEIRSELYGPFLKQFDARIELYRTFGDDTPERATAVLKRIVSDHPSWCAHELIVGAVGTRMDAFALANLLKLLQEDGFVSDRTEKSGVQNWRLSSSLVHMWWRQRGLGNP